MLLKIQSNIVTTVLSFPSPVIRKLAGPAIKSPEGYELHPQVQLLLRSMRIAKIPESWELPVLQSRQQMEQSAPLLAPSAHRVSTEQITIPGSDALQSSSMRARIYRPAPYDSKRCLVYFHGGGFVLGSLDSHDGVCAAIAERSGTNVVSVEYRLAPEHPFPAPVDDATHATRYVIENANALGFSEDSVGVGGDSAGGALAAVACHDMRSDRVPPAFQVLIYPITDCRRNTPSHQYFADNFLLSKKSADWFLERYLSSTGDVLDPRASPLLSKDFHNLPPAILLTAGFDILRDEGHAYAQKLREHNTHVVEQCYTGMVHGFLSLAKAIADGERAISNIADFIRARFS